MDVRTWLLALAAAAAACSSRDDAPPPQWEAAAGGAAGASPAPGPGAASLPAPTEPAGQVGEAGADLPAGSVPPIEPPPDAGFDFRLVRLDRSTIDTTRLCDIAEAERAGADRALASCWNGFRRVPVLITYDPSHAAIAEKLTPHQRIRVQVSAAGTYTGPEAIVRLLGVVGPSPGTAPGSVHAPPPPGPGPEVGFDFNRVNREPALHQTVHPCLVQSTDRVQRVDPAASPSDAASWIPVERAQYWVRATCTHSEGASRVIIASPTYKTLLGLRPGAVVRLLALHDGRYPQREAVTIFRDTAYAVPVPDAW